MGEVGTQRVVTGDGLRNGKGGTRGGKGGTRGGKGGTRRGKGGLRNGKGGTRGGKGGLRSRMECAMGGWASGEVVWRFGDRA